MCGTKPFYKGEEGYETAKNRGQLKITTFIRVYNYGGTANNEKCYIVSNKGLIDAKEGGEPVPPEEILSEGAAPDGWSIESDINPLFQNLLPKDDLEIFLNRKGWRDPTVLIK